VPKPAPFTPVATYLGQKWAGTVRAARNQTTGELRGTLTAMEFGSSAVHRFDRRWDRAGHLLAEQEFFSGGLWFSIANVWSGDQLVSSRYVDTVNGTGQTDFAWFYDQGRLDHLTATHAAEVSSAQVIYDSDGRITQIARSIDGKPWATQRWTYDGKRLAGNSTELVTATYSTDLLPSDDLAPLVTASSQLEWDAALPQPNGSCARLPHAFSYGYPVADGVYGLGWAVGDRPNGIDADSGFSAAYDSGLDRWFGHDRVESLQFRLPWTAPSVRSDLVYDAEGRMVSETLTTSDHFADSSRTRSFADNGLATDRRVLRRIFEQKDTTLTTELNFTLDSDGRLLTRTYTINGVLVGRHLSSYTDGELTLHSVATQTLGDDLSAAKLPKDLPAPIVHARHLSGPGNTTVELLRDGVTVETRLRDKDGRILSRVFPFSNHEQYSYSADGNLMSFSSAWSTDADLALSYDLAADGRLLVRRWAYTTTHDSDIFSYVCH